MPFLLGKEWDTQRKTNTSYKVMIQDLCSPIDSSYRTNYMMLAGTSKGSMAAIYILVRYATQQQEKLSKRQMLLRPS